MTPTDQIRDEIWAIITRYGHEADLTAYELIGVLEAIKADILDKIPRT